MIGELRAAIAQSLEDGAAIAKGARTWEVDCLVGLFRTGLPKIAAAFKTAGSAANLNVEVGGIFCHQSPKVAFPAGTCEIGDLLIVARYATTAPPVYWGLLLQTKMSDGPGLNAGDPQYTLYHDWPSFTWVKTGEMRAVTPPAPHPGAQVSTLDVCQDYCTGCSATAAVLDQPPRDLADVLFDVYQRASGRSFGSYETVLSTANTDWDRVIWDMLTFTVGSVAYRWKRAQKGTRPRDFGINGVFLRLADLRADFFDELLLRTPGPRDPALRANLETLLEAWGSEGFMSTESPSGPLRPAEEADLDEEDPGGISTLFIDVSAGDWQPGEQSIAFPGPRSRPWSLAGP